MLRNARHIRLCFILKVANKNKLIIFVPLTAPLPITTTHFCERQIRLVVMIFLFYYYFLFFRCNLELMVLSNPFYNSATFFFPYALPVLVVIFFEFRIEFVSLLKVL